jgi:hypothetical protein
MHAHCLCSGALVVLMGDLGFALLTAFLRTLLIRSLLCEGSRIGGDAGHFLWRKSYKLGGCPDREP